MGTVRASRANQLVNKMIVGKIVTYSELYGRRTELPKPTDLTINIPSPLLIHYFSFINSLNFLKPHDLDTEKWILREVLFRFEGSKRDRLLRQYSDAILNSRTKLITFFPLKSILLCIIDELKNPTNGKRTSISKEEELGIINRILVQNEIIDREYEKKIGKVDGDDPLALYKLIWPISFANSEFHERKKIYFALFKAINFLEFLEKFDKFKPYHKEFLERYSIKSSIDYIKSILLLLKNAQVTNKRDFTSYFHSNYDDLNPLTKEFILSFDKLQFLNGEDLNDFKVLRKTPIIKFDDGTFTVTNWNFVIDKFYPAIIYDFFNKTEVKQIYLDKHKNPKINNYLADIGQFFAEETLLHQILSKLLNKRNIILQVGDRHTKTFDLYLRIDRHVFLIEFKNISLPKKESFEEIKELIEKKFIKEGDDKKGILQLLDQVKKLDCNPLGFEDFISIGINPKRLVVYPIVIYTDNSLNMYGVNSYLNSAFRNEIKTTEPKIKFRVQDLVFISYDFFLDSYDVLKRRKIDFVYLMNYYYSTLFHIRKSTLMNRESPFYLHATFEDVVKSYMTRFRTYKNEQHFHGIIKKRLFSHDNFIKSSS